MHPSYTKRLRKTNRSLPLRSRDVLAWRGALSLSIRLLDDICIPLDVRSHSVRVLLDFAGLRLIELLLSWLRVLPGGLKQTCPCGPQALESTIVSS